MTPADVFKIRNQLYIMEKMLSAIKGNIDLSVAKENMQGSLPERSIYGAMEHLLTRPSSRDDVLTSPYDEISEGIFLGYKLSAGDFSCRVRSLPFESDSQDENGKSGSSCLVLAPNFGAETELDFLTVEAQLSCGDLKRVRNLRMEFVVSFLMGAVRLSDNFWVTLRVYREDGTHQDGPPRSFPAMQAPLSLNYHLNDEQYSKIDMSHAVDARAMISLPHRANVYQQFIMSTFKAVGASR